MSREFDGVDELAAAAAATAAAVAADDATSIPLIVVDEELYLSVAEPSRDPESLHNSSTPN